MCAIRDRIANWMWSVNRVKGVMVGDASLLAVQRILIATGISVAERVDVFHHFIARAI